MIRGTYLLRTLFQLTGTLLTLRGDAWYFLRLCLRPSPVMAAENLFLRKQLTLYQARHVKPRHATDATRFTLVRLARWFDWRQALAVVQPATFLRWHRQGFRRRHRFSAPAYRQEMQQRYQVWGEITGMRMAA
jgi:hypothetical protein